MKRIAHLSVVVLVAALLPGCAYIDHTSQTDTGVQANSDSAFASLSADGRWVAFQSFANNLVPGDTNGKWDVFVRDNVTKKVVRVSVRDDGVEGNGHSQYPSISDNGRYVVFASEATNISSYDTNTGQDIYFHDRDIDNDGIFDEPNATITRMVSVTTTGQAAPFGSSTLPKIYGNGHGVVYASTAVLAPEDTNGPMSDVYSTDLSVVPLTRLISKPATGSDPANGGSESAAVNTDGSVVAFATTATNLVAGDTNGREDVVISDAHTSPPTLTRATGALVANDDNDSPDVSRDALGRFVAFDSAATNIIPGKTNTVREVYVLDRSTGLITAESRTPFFGGSPNGPSVHPSISADGARVAFESDASNLADDTNGQTDVFVRDRASDLTQSASTAQFLDQADGASHLPAMSADGRYVGFHSGASNLISPDTNGGGYDVFTHAAITPVIFSVVRYGLAFPLGSFEAAPHLNWGGSTVPNTLHIRGEGFAPDATVDLGPGITISNLVRTPTDITFEANVPDGTTAGTRNLNVANPGSPALGGQGGTRLCLGCVAIQRWVALPDPTTSNPPFVLVVSDGEFTQSTQGTGFTASYLNASMLLLTGASFHAGDNDLTLDGTTSGTVTCSACVHVG